MKNYLAILSWEQGKEEYRRDIELPEITPEEYDSEKHNKPIYKYPEGAMTANTVYLWTYVSPSQDELKKLIELGKWAVIKSDDELIEGFSAKQNADGVWEFNSK